MTNAMSESRAAELAKLLADMNEKGRFPVAVLTDRQ